MGEAVEQSAGEPLGAEDLGPFVEGEIACDQDERAFVSLAKDLKQEFSASLGQGHEAELVNDEQFIGSELFLEAQQVLLIAGFDQLADQSRGGGEANAMAALAGDQAESQG